MPTNKHETQIIRDEHEPGLYAKRTSLVSAATVYAVVNTSATEEPIELDASEAWIGLATVEVANELTALATVNVSNELTALATTTLAAGTAYIGLASVNVGGTVAVDATGQGDVPITLDSETVELAASSAFIGLVSTASVNGTVEETTSKTLIHKTLVNNTTGNVTVFVPTNTFKVTNILLSSNSTVGINIKSGPTYLTGNASIFMTIFPGGGFVSNGDLLNPVFDGLAAGGAFVIETDFAADLAGNLIYYEE